MRILVVSNFYPPDVRGGYELGCRQAVDALRRKGHEVLVLTSAPQVPVADEPHVHRTLQLADVWDAYSIDRSAPVGLRLNDARAFQINAFNVHSLNRAIAQFRPDAAYLWMLAGLGGLGLIACIHHVRLPWVWHLMDEVPPKLCSTVYQVRPALAREFSRQLRGTFLSCSRQLLEGIDRQGFSIGERSELIPNWVDGPLPPLRSRFYSPGGPLRIVAAAATIERSYDKGIDLLIRAAAMLRASGEDRFQIDIFGRVNDGWYAGLIRGEGLSDRVRLRGSIARPDLIERHADYDVFAFPGRVGEPNAFAPLEAMPSGCVPILGRGVGNAEWLIHGVDCLKAARSAEGFASAFSRVMRGEIALAPIGRRAARAVRRDFHLDRLLPSIEAALERAARLPRDGAGSPDEAYRLAVLAEKMTYLFMQEPDAA